MSKRLVVLLLFLTVAVGAFGQAASSPKPLVVEYYYKVKWGHQQEFLDLFKKNHYPLLKEQIEMGRMTSVTVTAPRYHRTNPLAGTIVSPSSLRTPLQPSVISTNRHLLSNFIQIRRPISAKSSVALRSSTSIPTCPLSQWTWTLGRNFYLRFGLR